MEELVKYAKALVALQLEHLASAVNTDERRRLKPEVLLTRLGFSQSEVAELLGKTTNAVKMAIRDSKKSRS